MGQYGTTPLARSRRKAAGAYFTPEPIVQYIVRHTLDRLLQGARPDRPLRVLEPACGHGVFLVHLYRHLLQWHLQQYVQSGIATSPLGDRAPVERAAGGQWQLSLFERKRILQSSLFGVEQDRRAVEATRQALARVASPDDPVEAKSLRAALRSNIRWGDALIGPDFGRGDNVGDAWRPFSWEESFPQVLASSAGGFDAVIGNPPYVNIRVLTRARGEAVKRYLQERYRCARGAYDLYVLFVEKAFRLLRPGGMCGLIVPNKIASLQYARQCRSLLIERTKLHRIVDVSECRTFPSAGVYPYIVIWQKGHPEPRHRLAVTQVGSLDDLNSERPAQRVCQAELSAEAGFCLHGRLDVESRTATRPLGEVAAVHSGTTGFQAAAVAAELREHARIGRGRRFEFIVSGNIDRYRIRLGNVRFMKRRFTRPILPAHSEQLTDSKRALFQNPKIVIAGMGRRLEAAFDPGGLALGVQVYAVAEIQEDVHYLLGLLNSRLLSYLFRIRFRAKQLSGGYLAVNKRQLLRLPIRHVDETCRADQRCRKRIIGLVQAIQSASQQLAAIDPHGAAAEAIGHRMRDLDRRTDAQVYRLYGLTEEEVDRVESAVG